MAIVKFNVACIATYQSELEIPDEIKQDNEKIIEYINANLNNCNVHELTWLNDLEEDAVTVDDIAYVED